MTHFARASLAGRTAKSRPRRASIRALAACATMLALTACEVAPPGADLNRAPGTGPTPTGNSDQRSAKSQSLQSYYRNLQANRLTYGLLRTDGGGVDTPFSGDMLLRNFERIAFFDEYVRGPGSGRGAAQPLRKWTKPVRVRTYFGDSVPDTDRARDGAAIASFVTRLARITGHPMGQTTGAAANMHVFVVGEDDRAGAVAQIRALEPGTGPDFISFLERMPRNTYCLVLAYGEQSSPHVLRSAIVLIRAELPDLMRRSCIHEEIAQGLGLLNDSPDARPSIFNDDHEFALLTNHDEALLQLLYDPRLSPEQSAQSALPVIQERARSLASPGAGAS